MLTALVAAAQITGVLLAPRPLPPITDPLFAASPIRELRRDWDGCIGEVEELSRLYDRGAQQTLDAVFQGCEEKDSVLSGQVIRKYGYVRGSRAMENARAEIAAKIKQQFKSEAQTALQTGGAIPGFQEKVAAWAIYRMVGGCGALQFEQVAPYYPSVSLTAARDTSRVVLQLQLSADDQHRAAWAGNYVMASLVAISPTRTETTVGNFRFTISRTKDGVEFDTFVTDSMLRNTTSADRVQMHIPPSDVAFGPSFPIENFNQALSAVRRCATMAATK